MLVTGRQINPFIKQEKVSRPNLLVFKGNVKDVEQDDDKKSIPDPVYNFFYELPKYQLHSHFNGATPLNLSKLFLNKENKFIGVSVDELDEKYNDIRKKSASLADWLKQTYELKAGNLTSLDVMTAAYAIATQEAKHNGRYVEVRIDPFSSSFVGDPEDIIRATEAGLRNAVEDIKDQGKELKTGIILLGERHTDPKNSLKTAKLATKLKSQRVLYEKMYDECKTSMEKGKSYDYSNNLADNYLEFLKTRKTLSSLNMLTDMISSSKNYNSEEVKAQLEKVKALFDRSLVIDDNTKVPFERIDNVYKSLTVSNDKKVSSLDIAPALYSEVLQKARNGEDNIVVYIDPTDSIYKENPEDVLRAVQVGLRNAEIDTRSEGKEITTSIHIKLPENINSEEAANLSKLSVKMKGQRVLFEDMHSEMKEALDAGKTFEKSEILDSLFGDFDRFKKLKTELENFAKNEAKDEQALTKGVKRLVFLASEDMFNPTAQHKLESTLQEFHKVLAGNNFDINNKEAVLKALEDTLAPTQKYIEEKTITAEKIYDNLKHYSVLKLADKKDGTNLGDRYLRMGTGLIPNVTSFVIDSKNDKISKDVINTVEENIRLYNERKICGDDQLEVINVVDHKAVDIKDVITNKALDHSRISSVMSVDTVNASSDEIGPVYTKEAISQEIDTLINIAAKEDLPQDYSKLALSRGIREVTDKISSRVKHKQQDFLLSRIIFENLKSYSELNADDKANGTKDAKHFSRMGLNIIPNVVGFDLAGNENDYPLNIHANTLKHIKYYNDTKTNPDEELKVTIHAGEVRKSGNLEGWQNIEEAVKLGAHRIGHGIDLRNAPQSLKDEVKFRNVIMETCPKVNFQTKAVEGYRNHPVLDFLDQDIPATINTDNPVTAGTNMTNEFVKLFKRFNMGITTEERNNGVTERFTLGHVKKLIHNAIWGTFALTPQEKQSEEDFAMNKIDSLVKKYDNEVVLKEDEPIMLKVQKQVVAFTGGLKKAFAKSLGQKEAA